MRPWQAHLEVVRPEAKRPRCVPLCKSFCCLEECEVAQRAALTGSLLVSVQGASITAKQGSLCLNAFLYAIPAYQAMSSKPLLHIRLTCLMCIARLIAIWVEMQVEFCGA